MEDKIMRGTINYAMRLFHRTNPQAAASILQEGFLDGTGTYGTSRNRSGVFLSSEPLDENDGACGDILLEVNLHMTEAELARYEWVEEGKWYREFFVPAAEINPRMTARIVEDRREWESDFGPIDNPGNQQT
jgi:hypothetical protein